MEGEVRRLELGDVEKIGQEVQLASRATPASSLSMPAMYAAASVEFSPVIGPGLSGAARLGVLADTVASACFAVGR